LDGDKIATLYTDYLARLVKEMGEVDCTLGVVQTAYANGASTIYMRDTLGIKSDMVPTGVKHLHKKAHDYDIGVYFEANGHGTVLFKDAFVSGVESKLKSGGYAGAAKAAAEKMIAFYRVINQATGDALADMLAVEAILLSCNWSISDFAAMYKDLPNRQLKCVVADRGAVKTTWDETTTLAPHGMQEKISSVVGLFTSARSFVRPSGTEDVVRVYAEATSQGDADELAYLVGLVVHELAGGVGAPLEPPPSTLERLKERFAAHGQDHCFSFEAKLSEDDRRVLYSNLATIDVADAVKIFNDSMKSTAALSGASSVVSPCADEDRFISTTASDADRDFFSEKGRR
jgi:phosphoacetylglucosamine mutase